MPRDVLSTLEGLVYTRYYSFGIGVCLKFKVTKQSFVNNYHI